ncbi:MAG: GNAT family N-acetyltransferase [Lachnospiraceae bacterium]|nr:GNAT family N-acetyltransferase [Lachnospiraceae bacterium]
MSGELPYEIRFMNRDEWEEAMGLTWKTFLEFEGDDYSPEGVRSFEDFITNSGLKRMFIMGTYQVMAAFSDGRMVGVISLRNETHISLLFVDGHYHRRGIGRALILALAEYVKTEIGKKRLTVNASPYGVGFYHRLGFQDLGPERQQDGIIFTPMFLNI